MLREGGGKLLRSGGAYVSVTTGERGGDDLRHGAPAGGDAPGSTSGAALDRLAALAADLLNTPIAFLWLNDGENPRVAGSFGMLLMDDRRITVACNQLVNADPKAVFVVADADLDQAAWHGLLGDGPGVGFLAGIRLTGSDNRNLGVLCAADPSPRPELTTRQRLGLKAVAELAVEALEHRRDLALADVSGVEPLARMSRARDIAEELARRADEAEAVGGLGHWRYEAATSCLTWSAQLYRIYGLAVGSRLEPSVVQSMMHPDDREARTSRMMEQIKTGEPDDGSVHRVIRVDGEVRYLECRSVAERGPDGAVVSIFGTVLDVTDQKRVEAALAESEARLRQLAEHSSDVTFQVDLDDLITYVSPAVRRYGWSPEDIIGQPRQSFVHPADQERLSRAVLAMLNGGPLTPLEDREFRIRTKSGDFVWMEGSPAIVRDEAGSPTAVISVLRNIQERKVAEMALAESELRYRVVTEASRDVIMKYGLDGTVLYASSAARRFGYEPTDLIGTNGFDLIHPEDRESTWALMRTQVNDASVLGSDHVREFRLRKADGSWVWMAGNPTVLRDSEGRPLAIINSLRDVTGRKETEVALAASEARYRGLADAAPDMISETGLDGTILYISPACEAITGLPPNRFIGHNVFDLMHPEDQAHARAVCQAVAEGAAPQAQAALQFRGRHLDGRELWLECRPSAMTCHATGEVIGFIDVIRDITAHKALEAELKLARTAAEAASAVKSDFLANMSHELRTPLTSVLGFTQLALQVQGLPQDARTHLTRVVNAGAALLTTVNDILDFSKLEAGHVEIRRRPSDVCAVSAETLELFSERAAEKGLRLRQEMAGVPEHLDVDPDRLRQLLLNLVGNAVKFSDAGEVVVKLQWNQGDEILQVSVCDAGPGIPADQLARLFKRFSQVDGSSTRRHGGTGLGLAICRGLVEAMGGEIGVESREGQGSRFYFTLPAARSTSPLDTDDADPDVFAPGTRVLVADDHRVNRELVTALLTPLGAMVVGAADGAEAVKLASASPFDVILMDLRMPGMDGLTAMRSIRQGQGPNAGAPILAFSAGVDSATAEDRLVAGFDGDLSKPIVARDMIATVAAYARQGSWPRLQGASGV